MTRLDHRSVAPSGASGKGSRHARTASLVLTAVMTLTGTAAVAAQSPTIEVPGSRPATTLTDDTGTVVTFPSNPDRVISLSPAITETAFALGAGDRIVGGTDYDDYPAEAAALPDVATFTGVLMEQVVALEPDLVLAAGNGFTPDADIVRMRELGYPVVVVYAEDVEGVMADIRLIGDALGGDADAAAESMATDMAASIEHISALVAATGNTPRTFYEIGDQPELYGPAPDSFIADLVRLAGGDAITTTDPAVFSIPVEQLIVADPEVIVLGDALYGVCPDVVAARPGWAGITAVTEGAVRPVNDTVITRPGPRLAEGLASLARAIHPELADELADFPADPPMCAVVAPTAAPPASGSAQP
ncbi:MAG: helical backbone metal receptor [Chloroflexi bacterium]|nr:helical backbone metal receptor [Chloroflexota bacterium]